MIALDSPQHAKGCLGARACVVIVAVILGTCTSIAAAARQSNESTPQRIELSADEATAWQADLTALSHILPAMHPDPFHSVPREPFDSAVRQLRADIPHATREEVIAGLAAVVATLGDAHTSLQLHQPAASFHHLPVRFYLFGDGLFIRSVNDPRYADMAGARVVAFGGVAVDEAISRAGKLVSHENDFWVTAIAPLYLQMPEVLFALGLSDAPTSASLNIEVDGVARTVRIAATGLASDALATHGGGPPAGPHIDMLDRASYTEPLWLQHPDKTYWYTHGPYSASGISTAHDAPSDSALFYVAYRGVVNQHGGPSNAAFFDEVFALADSIRPARFVLDVRENGGGNGFYNRDLVRRIIRRPWLDQSDRLFVIIGRGTFSAGIQLVNDLEYFTEATLVGEPTGNAPNQFGDAQVFELPNSHLRVSVSSIWHQSRRPGIEDAFVAPDIYAPLTSSQYRAGVDPALAAIVSVGAGPTLEDVVSAGLSHPNDAELTRLFDAYRNDTSRKFADAEAELNALGYEYLRRGEVEEAIRIFTVNTVAYPGSANTFDSLGEALEAAGRRDEAIAAFRKALEIDPGYGSSLDAIRRLTGESTTTPTQGHRN